MYWRHGGPVLIATISPVYGVAFCGAYEKKNDLLIFC